MADERPNLDYANEERAGLSTGAKVAIALGLLIVCGLGYALYVMTHFLDAMP
jgi:hypothetical protein